MKFRWNFRNDRPWCLFTICLSLSKGEHTVQNWIGWKLLILRTGFYPLKTQISFHTLRLSESPRWSLLNGLLNIFLLISVARLPRDGEPVVADSGLEHGDTAVQPGSVSRGREVVWPCHELHPPPGIPAGKLWGAGKRLVERKKGDETNGDGCSGRAW